MLRALQREMAAPRQRALPTMLRRGAWVAWLLLLVQVTLGGWVSANYAVLACTGFPQCNGVWWPPTDFAAGFSPFHALGEAAGGGMLPFEALVAIHLGHRLFSVVAAVALLSLAWRLWRRPEHALRRFGTGVAWLASAQVASGLSNVVLGWPLAAALAHSAGAVALVLLLSLMLARGTVGRLQS
jgi:cytochrome c oxidase assembly protein subunit 15